MHLVPGAERVELSLEPGLVEGGGLEGEPPHRDAGREAALLGRPLVGEVVLARAHAHYGEAGG